MNYQIGPDAFSGNATVDWAAAKSAGRCSFALLRACEDVTIDPTYATYRAQCAALGITTGPWLFFHFGSAAASPQAQAEALFKATGPLAPGDFAPTIDVEFPGGSRSKYGITAQQALDAVRACAQRIFELYGCWPMIYTSAEIWSDPDGMDGLPAPDLGANCALWDKYWPIAQGAPAVYDEATVDVIGQPAIPSPWSSWQLQQYEGDCPGYPGFPTDCDLNRAPVLELGASGPQVAWLQARVGVTADGDFGNETKAAVEAFQTAHGLTADGVAGVETIAAATRVVLPQAQGASA